MPVSPGRKRRRKAAIAAAGVDRKLLKKGCWASGYGTMTGCKPGTAHKLLISTQGRDELLRKGVRAFRARTKVPTVEDMDVLDRLLLEHVMPKGRG